MGNLIQNKTVFLEIAYHFKTSWSKSDIATEVQRHSVLKKIKISDFDGRHLAQSRVSECRPFQEYSWGHQKWALKAAYSNDEVQGFLCSNGLWLPRTKHRYLPFCTATEQMSRLKPEKHGHFGTDSSCRFYTDRHAPDKARSFADPIIQVQA